MAHASCAGLGSKIAHLLLISVSDITKFPPSDNSAGTHMVECGSIMLVLPCQSVEEVKMQLAEMLH